MSTQPVDMPDFEWLDEAGYAVDEDYFEDDPLDDCGWDGNVSCMEMGTEYCEGACPLRDELERNYKRLRPRDARGRFAKLEAGK